MRKRRAVRELGPWAVRSQRRENWRQFYARYISSAEWRERRRRWAEEEATRSPDGTVWCRGSCGKQWRAGKDDLHHCSYDRLGEESHDDLWPLCRSCHDLVHEVMDSTRSWRRLPKRVANEQALAYVINKNVGDVGPRETGVSSLRDYL